MKTAGIWKCTVLSARFAADNDKRKSFVTVTVAITDGPNKGEHCAYEEEVTAQQGPYILRSINRIGWAGKSLSTLEADVAAWIKATGGASTVEIRHLEIKRGKRAGEIWDKVSSIGYTGERALAAPIGEVLSDADDVMRRAMESGGGVDPGAPPPADDDIPFASAAMGHDVSPIARVIR